MRTEEEMVAYALEVEPQLLPYLPELLADLEELGSDAEQIIEVLESLDLPTPFRVIDLGSGKGAVALEVAEDLDAEVLGIELFAPFVESSNALAVEEELADRCRFMHGNIVKLAGKVDPADVVIFAALGDVLGSLDKTMAVIRQYAKPGGYIVISDAFVRDGGSAEFTGFETYTDHAETIRRLTAHGDVLVKEFVDDGDEEEDSAEDDEETDLIQKRANALAKQHPYLAGAFQSFVDNQRGELAFIDENLVDAIWVLQKHDH